MVTTLEPDAHEKSSEDLAHEFYRDRLRMAVARADGAEFASIPTGTEKEVKLAWSRIEGGRLYAGDITRVSVRQDAGDATSFKIRLRLKEAGFGLDLIYLEPNAIPIRWDVVFPAPIPFTAEPLGDDVLGLLNDAVTQYEAHRVLTAGGVHGAADTVNAITATSPATTEAEAIALANDLKAKYNAHRVLTDGGVHGAPDSVNSIESPDAFNWNSAGVLVNEFKNSTGYEDHRVLTTGGVHGAADTTNVITAVDAGNRGFVWLSLEPVGGASGTYTARIHANPRR